MLKLRFTLFAASPICLILLHCCLVFPPILAPFLYILLFSFSTFCGIPRGHVFLPFIGIATSYYCCSGNYLCLYRLFYEELFYLLCSAVIVLLIFLFYFSKSGRKSVSRCVSTPFLCANIILIYVLSCYPFIFYLIAISYRVI